LVAGTAATAGVTVEILVERDQIMPVGIVVEQLAGTEDCPLPLMVR
jgi:hypothetical protein